MSISGPTRFPETTTTIIPGELLVGESHIPTLHSSMPQALLAQENKDVVAFPVGAALARHPSGVGFILASQAAISRNAIGLASVGVAAGFGEVALLWGCFCMFDWTAITGTQKLSPLTNYYLSAVAGQLTVTAPVAPGGIVQVVGQALSVNVLLIRPELPILL